MAQLKNRGNNTRNWVALAALVLAAGASSTACGGGDGGGGDGGNGSGGDSSGGNNAGGAGADGSGGDGAGNSGIDPDATVGQVRMAPCGKDEANLQAETYEATGWKAETECQPAFVSKWDTAQPGVSGDTEIRLPLVEVGTYDFWIDWGDSKISHITKWDADAITHSYAKKGEYDVQVVGVWEGFRFPEENTFFYRPTTWGDAEKLLLVSQWGILSLGATSGQFYHASSFEATATDAPDLSATTSLAAAFAECTKFNGAIGNWEVSTITNIAYTFFGASAFNQDVGDWDISKVTRLNDTFRQASSFNQDVGDWDTGEVIVMENTFDEALSFDQDIGRWNTSKVETIQGMFAGTLVFNQSLTNWDTSNIIAMAAAFLNATAFNGDLSAWDTSKVVGFSRMFEEASSFNQDISGWDTSSSEYFQGMFQRASSFNQDIGSWNMKAAIDMSRMLYLATSFDQDISGWDISKALDMTETLRKSAMSTENYSKLLLAWAKLPVEKDVPLGATGLTYNSLVQDSRDVLTNNGWIITDDGQAM